MKQYYMKQKKILLHDIQYTNGGPKTVLNGIVNSYLGKKYEFVRIHQVGGCGFNPIKAIKFVLHYKKVIDAENADVFYVCGLQYTGLLMTLAGKLSNVKKVVLSVHGSDWDNPDGTLRKWILMHIVEPLEVRLADSVFTVCEAAQRTIGCLRYARKGHNDGVVYNTFPNIEYDAVKPGKLRKELGISEDKIIVTSVGRVVKAKGHDYTIEAIKRISDPQFVFVVVGDGPFTEVYQEKCSDEIKEGRVHVLGSRSDVKEILKDSDIFLFTTLNENHSLALMEAVNMRCAAIATNVGGNPEIIQDNKTGILIPPRDNDAIVKALYKLQNPEMRMKYAQAAFDYCSSAFSIENTYGKLEKIFSES